MHAMARLDDIDPHMRQDLIELECPRFETQPWVEGPPLAERRVAIISTAGLQRRGDRPFAWDAGDYRTFPIDRLNELAAEGVIGSVARFHYSFMGATAPQEMESATRHLAGLMKDDDVDAVLLLPV
jgi:D-proline reductase (dithiol) PrdB